MKSSGRADAQTVTQRLSDRFGTVHRHGLPTALLGRPTKARHDAFADHGPFEFGEHPQHLEHHPARRRGRVQPLLVQIEVHVLGVSVVQEGDEIGQRSTEAVHAPRHDLFEVAAGHALQQSVEAGAPITSFGTANAFVGQDGDDIPALTLGDSVEFEKLVLDGLVVRRNTSIDCHPLGQSVLRQVVDDDLMVPAIAELSSGQMARRPWLNTGMNLQAFLPQPVVLDPLDYPHKVMETFDFSDERDQWRLDQASALAREMTPCPPRIDAASGQVVWSFEHETDAMAFALQK